MRIYYPSTGINGDRTSVVISISGEMGYPLFNLKRKIITSLVYFHNFFKKSDNPAQCDTEMLFNSYDDFFKPENAIFRIALAILCDNVFALKFLFEEYQILNKDKQLIDLITEYSLVGIAAANACTEVIKYFTSMNVNFEQKCTITIEQQIKCYEKFSEKSVLKNYGACSLDMSPLALALSAAPALPREDATTLIELFLNAKANYNNKITKRWIAVHGYYTSQTQEPRSKLISLFEFDQTGILDELLKKRREHKPARPHIKHEELQRKPENYSGEITVLSLKAELDVVKEENKLLKAEIGKLWAALRKNDSSLDNKKSATDYNLTPPGQHNSSQQFFRGRGRRN